MADRVAVLRAGELVQVATADELWNKPVDAYVARLVGLQCPRRGRISARRIAHHCARTVEPLQVTGRTFPRWPVPGVRCGGQRVRDVRIRRAQPARSGADPVHIDRVDPAVDPRKEGSLDRSSAHDHARFPASPEG